MNGITVRSAVEQVSSILSSYSADLDDLSYDGINSTIRALETFSETYWNDDNLSTLLGLVASIISDLYVARGLATDDVPRPRDYYQSIAAVRKTMRQIRSIR